jgi:flagellar protein FlgJ
MELPSSQLALDARGLDDLKRTAHAAPDKALKTAAKQFEALFMNMIVKNMREALPKDGLLSSSAGDTYTAMLDQQMSQNLAGKSTGLADMLVRQLSKNMQPAAAANAGGVAGAGSRAAIPGPAGPPSANLPLSASGTASHPLQRRQWAHPVSTATALGTTATAATATNAAAIAPTTVGSLRTLSANAPDRKREFVARLAQHAKAAEQTTGVPAKFILGQAALESGWGKHEITDASGQTTFNLFGVKATGGWKGATVDVTTTEFVSGVARKVVAKFRAYASYAEGFADYAKMIAGNPRYAEVLKTAQHGVASFAQGLQKAGYATDPEYASKLTRVINTAVKIDQQA